MLNNSDQEFLMFLTGCLCLALGDGGGFVVGACLIVAAFGSANRKKKKE